MYERIIVGYDGSDPSKAALKESSLWASKHGGKVLLVHGVYFDQEEFAIPPSLMEKRVAEASRILAEARGTASKDHGLDGRVEVMVREGEPPDVIAKIAAAEKADLIALGTFGRSGLKKLLVGSVTAEVILKAPCDVLVVKRPCDSCIGTYSSILVPFDGSEFSKRALGRAIDLAKSEGAKLTVLYVIPRYEEMVEFFRTGSIERSLRAAAEKVVESAQKIASDRGVQAAAEIGEGHAADEIVRRVSELANGLVVMGTHGWKGVSKAIVGSTTNRVITYSTTPVLVVR